MGRVFYPSQWYICSVEYNCPVIEQYPCLKMVIQEYLNSWLLSGTGCFFLISLRLNLDIKCRLISPRALSLFLPRHSTHIQASHSNWNAGHGFGRSTLRPPQPEFLHLPLRHGPPGALPESASACLQPLSMWVTVYSGLAIKVTLPFSLLIYCHYRCIHFLQHSCLYSWIFKGEKIYMFKTVFLFFINQYQASKQMFNWYEYKLIHACYIKLEN